MYLKDDNGGEDVRGTLNDQSLIYLQIAQMLEDDILRQIYQEGEQVPSTNELARSFNINPATAAKGINRLVSDGILFKKRGVGMFVSPGARQVVQKKRQTAFYGNYIKPMVKESASLGLTGEELLHLVQQAIEEGENCT